MGSPYFEFIKTTKQIKITETQRIITFRILAFPNSQNDSNTSGITSIARFAVDREFVGRIARTRVNQTIEIYEHVNISLDA